MRSNRIGGAIFSDLFSLKLCFDRGNALEKTQSDDILGFCYNLS